MPPQRPALQDGVDPAKDSAEPCPRCKDAGLSAFAACSCAIASCREDAGAGCTTPAPVTSTESGGAACAAATVVEAAARAAVTHRVNNPDVRICHRLANVRSRTNRCWTASSGGPSTVNRLDLIPVSAAGAGVHRTAMTIRGPKTVKTSSRTIPTRSASRALRLRIDVVRRDRDHVGTSWLVCGCHVPARRGGAGRSDGDAQGRVKDSASADQSGQHVGHRRAGPDRDFERHPDRRQESSSQVEGNAEGHHQGEQRAQPELRNPALA